MKNILIFLFVVGSLSAFGQAGSLSQSVYRSRVNDSTSVNGGHSTGYGDWYWNNQATTPHWDIWNGSSYDHVFDFNSGGGAGTPGGSDTQVQFNDASAFGGDAGMVYNKTSNRLTVDSVRVIDEAYGSGWNADTNVPTKNAVYDEIETKYDIVNSVVAITDASTMDITGPVHTLATSSATRTFTDSYTGVYTVILITLSATSSTLTFPAGALCTYEGVSSGNNTMVLSGVSGDKHEISIANYGSGVYSVNGINKGQ